MDNKILYEALLYLNKVEKIRVTRYTDKSYWTRSPVGGKDCVHRIGDNTHETFDEAKLYLLNHYKTRIRQAKLNVKYNEEQYEEVLQLKEAPDDN